MSTTKKKRTRFVIGIMLLFALCLFFMFHMVGKTKQLRSDSAGVEFVTEGGSSNLFECKRNFPLHVYCSETCRRTQNRFKREYNRDLCDRSRNISEYEKYDETLF
ncbi:MAG: hypothetical protein ACLT8A_08955 [Subdoligranulum sp.]